MVVTTPDQVLGLIANGESNRHYGATNMNATSSRSHTLFKMVIEMSAVAAGSSGTGSGDKLMTEWKDSAKKAVNWSSLFLVDLAGSERVKKVTNFLRSHI